MLSCVKRTALTIHEISVRKILYIKMSASLLLWSLGTTILKQHLNNRTSPVTYVLLNSSCLFHTTRICHIRKDWLLFPCVIGANIWTWCIYSNALLPTRIATLKSRSVYEKRGQQRRGLTGCTKVQNSCIPRQQLYQSCQCLQHTSLLYHRHHQNSGLVWN